MIRRSTSAILLLALSPLVPPASAQGLPPIFADTPRQQFVSLTIAEFPRHTFLENVAVAPDGTLFINSYEDGRIHRVTPAGEKSEFARVPGNAAGIAFDDAGNLIISGATATREAAVFRVDPRGNVETLATIPGAIFLNGVARLDGDRFLIADSYKGAIWAFDAKAKTSATWLTDPMLARVSEKNPTPAVNGLKVHAGALYATNTQAQKLFRIPIMPDGAAGAAELYVDRINGDDFAFDADGNLFVTTHIYNNVVRVAPDRTMTIVATETEGLTGSTALAFGRTASDAGSVYVVTNGGMSLPPPDGVQTAKVVRLDVGKPGAKP